jgi:hypothetical protein
MRMHHVLPYKIRLFDEIHCLKKLSLRGNMVFWIGGNVRYHHMTALVTSLGSRKSLGSTELVC